MAVEIPGSQFEGKIAQKAVIEHDGKIIVCRNVGVATWDLPGGRLHKGEIPEDGLKREVYEELGVEIAVEKPIHTATFNMTVDGNPHYYVAYAATLVDPAKPFVLAPDEIEAVQWVGKYEFETLDIWEACKESLRRYFR